MKINEQSLPIFDGLKGTIPYQLWATQVAIAIAGTKSAGALKPWPQIPHGSDTATIQTAREGAEDQARYILYASLSPTQRSLLAFNEDSKPWQIWEALKTKHGVVSLVQSQELQIKFNDDRILDTDTVETYVARLQMRVTHLHTAGIDITESSLLAKVVGELRHIPYYAMPMTVFSGKHTDDQDLQSLLTFMLQYETHNPRPETLGANAPKALSATVTSTRSKTCTYCKKTGHDVTRCYSKRRSNKGQSPASSTAGKFCNMHNSNGHSNEECRSQRKPNTSSATPARSLTYSSAFMVRPVTEKTNIVILDTGATDHMTPHKHALVNYKLLAEPITVYWGNLQGTQALGIGDLPFISNLQGNTERAFFKDVLYIPELGNTTLISASKICSNGGLISVPNGNQFNVSNSQGKLIFECLMESGLFQLNITFSAEDYLAIQHQASPASTDVTSTDNQPSAAHLLEENDTTTVITSAGQPTTAADLWHHRFGHISVPIVKKALQPAEINIGQPTFCNTCPMGKIKRPTFKHREINATAVNQLVHTDLCGPFPASLSNKKYFITLTDDYTRYLTVYFLATKTAQEVLTVFEDYSALVQTQHGTPIQALQSDNGGEFVNHKLDKFCTERGIKRNFSSTYTAPSNGVAERQNQSLVNMARCMLYAARLPDEFWAEAVGAACYTKNMVTTHTHLADFVPWTRWYGSNPPVQALKVWGCPVFSKIIKPGLKKLTPRARIGILVGYTATKDLYRVYVPATQKFLFSRDLVFNEDAIIHPELHIDTLTHRTPHRAQLTLFDSSDDEEGPIHLFAGPRDAPAAAPQPKPPHARKHASGTNAASMHDVPPATFTPAAPPASGSLPTPARNLDTYRRAPTVFTEQPAPARTDNLTVAYRRPIDPAMRPPTTQTYSTESAQSTSNTGSAPKGFIRKPAPSSVGIRTRPSANVAEIVCAKIDVPNTIEQAMASDQQREWQDAIFKEFKNLACHHTWDVMELPTGCHAIPCRWVFQVKYASNGTISEYKARLVVKGFHQIQGHDFNEIESPVASLDSIRALIAFAAGKMWPLIHMDVSGAFLNGIIEEDIYVKPAPGSAEADNPLLVYKLNKALYGLKQASYAWYTTLMTFLTTLGFRPSNADPCLLICTEPDPIYLILYVDDMLAVSASENVIIRFYNQLNTQFASKYIGTPELFLGIRVHQLSTGITLDQHHYIQDLKTRFQVPDIKPSTPADRGQLLDHTSVHPACNLALYRSLVGALLWIARCTRPDIAYVVGWLGRHNQQPTIAHLSIGLHTVAYLLNTSHLGLHYTAGEMELIGYTDSDFAEDSTRKSTSGYVFFLRDSNSPIAWKSKLQSLVTRSVTEAEYVSCSHGCQEATWFSSLFKQLGFLFHPVPIYVDNSAARQLTDTPTIRQNTKHIDIHYHYCRDRHRSGHVEINPISGLDNPADIFTKALTPTNFHNAVNRLNMTTS